MYVDAARCYRPSSMVCWCVTLVSLAKTAKATEMPFWLRTRVGPGNHVLFGVQIPPWEWPILGEKGSDLNLPVNYICGFLLVFLPVKACTGKIHCLKKCPTFDLL